MFDSVMKRMREKIRTCQYVMTIHAEEEMDDDELSIFDVECCILRNSHALRAQQSMKHLQN